MLNKFIIVVPAYNCEQWINRCLGSIVSQDYNNFEVVVIDDHSDDNTWNEIAGYDVKKLVTAPPKSSKVCVSFRS